MIRNQPVEYYVYPSCPERLKITAARCALLSKCTVMWTVSFLSEERSVCRRLQISCFLEVLLGSGVKYTFRTYDSYRERYTTETHVYTVILCDISVATIWFCLFFFFSSLKVAWIVALVSIFWQQDMNWLKITSRACVGCFKEMWTGVWNISWQQWHAAGFPLQNKLRVK